MFLRSPSAFPPDVCESRDDSTSNRQLFVSAALILYIVVAILVVILLLILGRTGRLGLSAFMWCLLLRCLKKDNVSRLLVYRVSTRLALTNCCFDVRPYSFDLV